MSNPTLSSGRLRHKVNIDQRVESQDTTTGELTHAWGSWATNVGCEFAFISGREFIQSGAVQGIVVARLTMRARAGLDSSMRISFRGKYYNIEGILPDPKSGLEWITVPVSEGVNNG